MQEPRHVAIVTGAASGIGRATAELFAERGHGVIAADIVDPTWCDGTDVVPLRADASSDDDNADMVTAALEHFGRLDASILNAGITGRATFEDDDALHRLDTLYAVNLRGVALGIRHAAPVIRATAGSGAIVATASTSGLGGDAGNFAYNATKAGVINLVRAAAIDYGASGIRINAVAPGPVETGMTARLQQAPELHDAMRRRIVLQRWGQPRELAEAFWFLASPAASFITGVTLAVDGGLSSTAGHFDLPQTGPPT
ncbi:MAG: SDR family NAD(P)-dependent oxidoreductase [Ilumatobacter sp.]|jgi:meso-butanediol dehydrogenase / (S,S)-butanediol dehydrogenase / diacetyl reductase|uniref:SDR family NAD(P)-dependent oxidoreductase n=1 Tax=Ilumatobacter sp. TaxID=1967498 RepID=UPI0039193146